MVFQTPFVPFPLEVWLNLDLLSGFIFVLFMYVPGIELTLIYFLLVSNSYIFFLLCFFSQLWFSVESILIQESRLLHSYPLLGLCSMNGYFVFTSLLGRVRLWSIPTMVELIELS